MERHEAILGAGHPDLAHDILGLAQAHDLSAYQSSDELNKREHVQRVARYYRVVIDALDRGTRRFSERSACRASRSKPDAASRSDCTFVTVSEKGEYAGSSPYILWTSRGTGTRSCGFVRRSACVSCLAGVWQPWAARRALNQRCRSKIRPGANG